MDPLIAVALALIPAIALVGLLFALRRDRSAQAGTSGAQPHTATGLSVLDEMTDGVLLSDRLGRLSYMNRAARKALLLTDLTLPAPLEVALRNQEDLLALLCVDAATADDRADSADTTVDGEGKRAIQSLELIDDHARRAFDVEMKDLIDSTTGQSMRLVVMRDVTDRNASERRLRLSELGLRQIIDLFPHLIYARDRSGKFLMANRAGAEAYGVEPRDVIDRTIFDVGLPDDTIARMLGQDQMVIDTGEEQHYHDKSSTSDGESVFQTTKIPFCIPETGEQAVLSIAIDITERIRTEERIRALAFYDSLTGLPNRRRFQRLLGRTLETSRRKQGRFALLFLDLDRFKEVNDRLGHSTGDHLLRDVAERLRDCVRMTDELTYAEGDSASLGESDEPTSSSNETVSRLAGDEFTILLADVVQPINAALVAKRIIDAMSLPFFVGSEEVFITASIGIALYPDDGLGSDALLRCADQAMYEAKRTGLNRYAFFDASMNAVAARRHEIHLHLRHAIECNELSLVYQQIRTAASGRICGCEALLRWRSEELGNVGPDEFIPVAEETGLIGAIGAWVLRQVCQQHATWREQGLEPVRIAVNVSAAQLQVPRFAAEVRAVMNDLGVTPDDIEFELTETAILAQDRQTDDNLRRLCEMGIALTLDDFGTGQSSLSNLRRFAFTRIKIDRSFVAEIPGNRDDANLTDAIIAMAHGLRLAVVAEGVETEEQLHFLRNHGCDELQGYLFARPESAEDFALHLESAKPTV